MTNLIPLTGIELLQSAITQENTQTIIKEIKNTQNNN